MGETLMRDIAAKVEGCNGASSSKVIEALNKNNSFKADAPSAWGAGCTNSYFYLLPPIYKSYIITARETF